MYFNIRPVYNLEKSNKYKYSKIKDLYKYRYLKFEKLYKYKYFRMKKLYKYEYPTNLIINKIYNIDKILNIFCNNNN